MNLRITLGIVGLLLGLPLSYFFQAPMIRNKMPLSEYIKMLPQIISTNPAGIGEFEASMIGNPPAVLIVTCLVCAFLFGLAGYLIERNRRIDS